jgi:hypothetical protein
LQTLQIATMLVFPIFVRGDLTPEMKKCLDEIRELALRRMFETPYPTETPQEYFADPKQEDAYKFYMQVDDDILYFVDRYTGQRLQSSTNAAIGIFVNLSVTDFLFPQLLNDAEKNGGVYSNMHYADQARRILALPYQRPAFG